MLHEIIQLNFPTWVLCFFIIGFILTNRSANKRTDMLFLLSAVMVFTLSIADSVEMWTKTFDHYSNLRIAMSVIGYTLRPMTCLSILFVIKRGSLKRMLIMSIPALANFVFACTAFFCPLVFSYTKDNNFIRGPLGYLPFIVSGFYLLLLIIYTIGRFKDGDFIESFISFMIVLVSAGATVMITGFGYKGLLNFSIITSLVFYYLFLHTQNFKHDVLTNALDRRCFHTDGIKLNNFHYFVISIDMNNLKVINDTKGHAMGDIALKSVVDTIVDSMESNCKIYRTGGDEFQIICLKADEVKVQKIVDKITHSMKKTKYSVAIGYSEHVAGADFDFVCARADKKMYENKSMMKKNEADGNKEFIR